ncbi:MAG TPA: M24 family metallopeptidase [Levilinea sp.]|nr:M24 family metallopeptidase [Levilinea sp.]
MEGFDQKKQAIKTLLEQQGLDALLLRKASSFAWATHGASSYINTASTYGEAALLITPAGRYLIANNIEATRLEKEEGLKAQGWEFKVFPWYAGSTAIADLIAGLKLGADAPYAGALDLSGEVARLRAHLTPDEQERFHTLGAICAEAMHEAIATIEPGMTEEEIAATLAEATQVRGAQPIVNLIATDERIYNFRHPLPTTKELEKYAMLVLCGRWKGLVASITRLVHFGKIPADLRRRIDAVAHIDAVLISATRPGRTLGDVFADGQKAYADSGFAGEWTLHHQGGPAGYEPREWVAIPGNQDIVLSGQAYAWNPSITGAKSEDTVLVDELGWDVVTDISEWPVIEVNLPDGTQLNRPDVLEIA